MSLLTIISLSFSIAIIVAGALVFLLFPKMALLILKNLRRNMLRTSLTAVAIAVFAVMITMIWTVVSFIDETMEEQSHDIKLIISERWLLPSQMPMTHANYLDPESPDFLQELKPFVKKGDFMTWSFYGGTTDGKQMTRENMVFMFSMKPDHIKPMMDDLENIPDAVVAELKANPQNVLLGRERMETLNLQRQQVQVEEHELPGHRPGIHRRRR